MWILLRALISGKTLYPCLKKSTCTTYSLYSSISPRGPDSHWGKHRNSEICYGNWGQAITLGWEARKTAKGDDCRQSGNLTGRASRWKCWHLTLRPAAEADITRNTPVGRCRTPPAPRGTAITVGRHYRPCSQQCLHLWGPSHEMTPQCSKTCCFKKISVMPLQKVYTATDKIKRITYESQPHQATLRQCISAYQLKLS